MKYLITLSILLIISLSAKSDDYKVLWEMEFSPHAGYVLVSDDGKYFYYSDSGYVKFHDSKTGKLLNQLPDREFLLLGGQDYYLLNDKVVLPFSLDSILIYNIATQKTDVTINLNYKIDNPNIRLVSLSPNKRFLYLVCFFNEERHLIIIDLEQKKLYKDWKLSQFIEQIFNTNDPNRMIVIISDPNGKQLKEIILDDESPLGYWEKTIEVISKDGDIRGQKYDANEDAFYYLYLYEDLEKKLVKFDFQDKINTILYEGVLGNRNNWYSENNQIILFEYGYLFNLISKEWFKLRQVDNIQQISSSSNGLKTVLLRVYNLQGNHTLMSFDVNEIITKIEIEIKNNNNELNISPNPTTGLLNVSINNIFPSLFNYELISDSGQILISNDLGLLIPNQSNLNIDISAITNGHYILRVFNDREDFTFNIIKEG